MIHIIPASTGPGGVADYAVTLAEALARFQPGTLLFAGNAESHRSSALPGRSYKPESVCELLQGFSPDIAILHYANYGYAKRGCPFWLVEAISKWKSESRQTRLITVFHEVNASGPPWRSSFWLAPMQRRIAKQILNLSDAAITSMELYRNALIQLNPDKRQTIQVLPVFSTVGEPPKLPQWKDRLSRMILFGGKGARTRVRENSLSGLLRACNLLDIREVFDIGPTINSWPSLGNLNIVPLGELKAEKVSHLMQNARAAFFDYPPSFLTKSTVFASYCAHGLLPVTVRKFWPTEAGLEENVHYWNLSTLPSCNEPEKIASNAFVWYQSHRLQKHLKLLIDLLHDVPNFKHEYDAV